MDGLDWECPLKDFGGVPAGAHCVMGIDEAGRGPVLGPMVYAGFVCPAENEPELKKMGFADSKQLAESKRDALYAEAKKLPWALAVYRSLSPEFISKKMLRKAKINLNIISHESAASLVANVLKRGIVVDALFVDVVGDAGKYRAFLAGRFPQIKSITVESKADANYPCVSAASVVAKVNRDAVVRSWVFKETVVPPDAKRRKCFDGQKSAEFSKNCGSGYPGDPNTVQWLRTSGDPVFGFPSFVRFSWKTCDELIKKNGVKVKWEGELEDEENAPVLAAARQGIDMRPLFFRNANLELLPATHFAQLGQN